MSILAEGSDPLHSTALRPSQCESFSLPLSASNAYLLCAAPSALRVESEPFDRSKVRCGPSVRVTRHSNGIKSKGMLFEQSRGTEAKPQENALCRAELDSYLHWIRRGRTLSHDRPVERVALADERHGRLPPQMRLPAVEQRAVGHEVGARAQVRLRRRLDAPVEQRPAHTHTTVYEYMQVCFESGQSESSPLRRPPAS